MNEVILHISVFGSSMISILISSQLYRTFTKKTHQTQIKRQLTNETFQLLFLLNDPAMTMHFALVLDMIVTSCKKNNQLIVVSPIVNAKSEVDILPSKSPPEFEPQYPISSILYFPNLWHTS